MQCVNCKNEIKSGGLVCPYCHTNPIIFGSTPYSGLEDHGPIDLFGWLAIFFSGNGKKKLAKNETEYIVIPWHQNSKMWKCANCGTLSHVGSSYCAYGCKKNFVGEKSS
jgi:Double zinc ribbon